MERVVLSSGAKAAIGKQAGRFRKYLQSPGYEKERQERAAHVRFVQQDLPARLPELSEADVTAIIRLLYATRMWGNKEYRAQKVISDNGIDKLREELGRLLDTSVAPSERYWRFLQQVEGFGPASVTEMLCYRQPGACGIWNKVAREGLTALGISEPISPAKYTLSAQEYATFNELVSAIGDELRAAKVPDVDHLLVDFFLYEVTLVVSEAETKPLPTEFDHDEVRDLILDIGVMLGFDADTEVRVAHGAKVDSVWRARIANLGLVTYVFEVHKGGSIDSLILNLQKAKSNPTVQKVIAVSDSNQLAKIQAESEALPEEFRRALAVWPVEEVVQVGESLRSATESISRLGLLPGES